MKISLFIAIASLLISYTAHASSSCPQGQYWVKSHLRKGHFRNGKYVSPTTVKAHCKMLTKAYTFWNSRLKNSSPKGWPHSSETFKNWSTEERELLFEALEKLPPELWSEEIQSVYRARKSKDHPNPATSADHIIVLYDSAFQRDYDLSRVDMKCPIKHTRIFPLKTVAITGL